MCAICAPMGRKRAQGARPLSSGHKFPGPGQISPQLTRLFVMRSTISSRSDSPIQCHAFRTVTLTAEERRSGKGSSSGNVKASSSP
ncbi:hypothetical protein CEXT_574191 [Caerostris extrusa]|uniref:Uncharacterized protein n=1 Tax=Caerostris extrusa TaxID=172846 RepID=A0AAV4M812_CAEEX|nr:hypothetical protein CEXT_574191 [Caerostris extrusa]